MEYRQAVRPTYALRMDVISNDFEWPRAFSKIFSDAKHRAASLRQFSFLLYISL